MLSLSLILLVSALHAAPVELSDSFDGSPGLDWRPLQVGWQVSDGSYRVSGTGQALLGGASFAGLSVEFDLRFTDAGKIPADWAGVAFGGDLRAGMGSAYVVYLRYAGQIELFREGRILAAADTGLQADLAAGRYVHIAVSVAEAHIAVQVNGRPLIAYDAPASLTGQLALMTCDIGADFARFHLRGDRLGSMISGEVLAAPSWTPVPGASVEIYNSMDGYDSPVTRETVTDAKGRYEFRDLPTGEKAYWLRAGKEGLGGSTAWFVTVSEGEASTSRLPDS